MSTDTCESLKLKFVLENSGTAPADDVHLNLWTEADGVWLDTPPAMPKWERLVWFKPPPPDALPL